MKRQQAYLKGLIKQIKGLSSDEILDLYDNLMDYSVTNMGSGDIVDLADMARQYTQLENIEIEGTYDDSGRFRAFEIDEDSLQHVILELFYTRESKEG
jgi:anionic cell wall polymer biosynthesis LytR-Cps2A-Psr (LCP) family protein